MATSSRSSKANGKHQEQAAALDQTTPAGGSLAFRVMPLDCFVRTVMFTKRFGRVSFSAAGNAVMECDNGNLSHLMTLAPGIECRFIYVYVGEDHDCSGWFVGSREALDEFQAFQNQGKVITDARNDIDKQAEEIHQGVQSFIYGGSAVYAVEAE